MMFDLRDKVIALAAALILAAIAFGAGYHYGDKARGINEDLKAANLKIEQDNAKLDAIADNETLKRKLEAKTNEANDALDFLLNTPVRVRVPTTCPTNPIISASVSSVPAASPQRASNPAQDAFDVARRGMESDAAEWSRALNSCRELQDWALTVATGGGR